MASWDRRSPEVSARQRDAAIRAQFAHAVGPFSPFWNEKMGSLGVEPAMIRTAADLARLPATGERDVCPDGDPAGMARLVVEPPQQWAVHAGGLALRRAMWRRLFDRDAYRRAVDVDTRPTAFVEAGLGLRYLLACTRGDLDLMARAGARLMAVLGVTRADSLLACLTTAPTVEFTGLQLAALASGVPAVYPGTSAADAAEVLRLFPATLLAAPADRFADLVEELSLGGADLASVRLGLLVGAPSAEDRVAAEQALSDAVGSDVVVLAVHAPQGARVLWGECAGAGEGQRGLHTYPDLEVVELADPDSGEAYEGQGPAEPLVTQLGFRGSALVRWRTGDVISRPLLDGPCPGCGRQVPRLPSEALRAGALVRPMRSGKATRLVDLRALAAAVTGHPAISDWAISVGPRARDAAPSVVVHLGVSGGGRRPDDDHVADVCLEVAERMETLAGAVPSQIVAAPSAEFAWPRGEGLTAHIVTRAGG